MPQPHKTSKLPTLSVNAFWGHKTWNAGGGRLSSFVELILDAGDTSIEQDGV